MSTLSTFKVLVSDSETVRKTIVQEHNSGQASIDWNLVDALTHDYQRWFHGIMNAVDTPDPRKDAKWQDGEPQWLLVFDQHGFLISYVSVLLTNGKNLIFHSDKVLDVYVKEGIDLMEIIPVLRTAVENLFWFHQFHQEHQPKQSLKSLKVQKEFPKG